jgi:hypothetical protein
MILDHTATTANLQPKYVAIYQFFASQRSYGYALSQENRYLAHIFSLRTLTEVAA